MSASLSPESAVAAKVFPSANHGERKDGRQPNMIILHYTGMPDSGEALQWLANPISQVSAHYFVFEDGRVLQMVPEARRAWHAGKSSWDGEIDINSSSIGIEIANPGHPGGLPAFPDEQIASLTRAPEGHRRPLADCAGARAWTFRRRAWPKARPRRSLSVATSARGRNRSLGSARSNQ